MDVEALDVLQAFSVVEDSVGRWWVKRSDGRWKTGAALVHSSASLVAGYRSLTLVHDAGNLVQDPVAVGRNVVAAIKAHGDENGGWAS